MRTLRIARFAFATALAAGACVFAQSYPPGPPPGAQYPPSAQPYPPSPYPDDSRYDDGDYDYQPAYDARGAAMDLGIFYRELAPYGQWLRHPYYGWVWFPRGVGYGWRPYTVGRWVNSNYGWTWVSYEPFGWATYHYGRWALDRRLGWIWIPGTVWGPAWVAWQQGEGYVGWAPLPPQVGFQAGIGIRLGNLDLSISLEPFAYSFVPEREFLASRLDRYVEPPARNVTIIRRTRNITDYGWENDRVVNRGVPVERIEQITRQPVRRLEVVDTPSRRETEIRRDEVRVYRPAPSILRDARGAERNNDGVRLPPPQEPTGPGRPAPRPVEVAPAPPARATDFERVQRDQQRELDRAAQLERQKLQEAQQRDARQGRAPRAEAEQQRAAELKAQQELQQRQAEQMKNRLQIQRQAQQPPAERRGRGQDDKNQKQKKDKNDDQKPPRG